MIIPTATQMARLRRQLSQSETDLPDAEIQDLFVEAAEMYPAHADDARVMYHAARCAALEELWFQASAEVDYDQNDSSEKAGQRAKMLEKISQRCKQSLKLLIVDVDKESAGSTVVRWGSMKPMPTREEEYPDA